MDKRFLFIFFLFLSQHIRAQDTLPDFSVILNKDRKAELNWYNDYGVVRQITIQRSADSLKNFASITSMPNPLLKRDSYLDTKTKPGLNFYRLGILLPEGKFVYTASKRAVYDLKKDKPNSVNGNKNKDTVKKETGKPEKPKPFVPSDFIFTDKKSNVLIVLPDVENKNYSIRFYDKNNVLVLTIPRLKENNLILEKYNFMHSGWFSFEIYENGVLFEKNKFQIVKD
jgi:hypothetical protein